MNNIRRFVLSLATILLFSGLALGAPVSARGGNSGPGGGDDVVSSTSDDTSTSSDDTSTEAEAESHDLAEQFMRDARVKIKAERQNGQEHSQAQRQQACEARKSNLTRRMDHAATQAQKHKDVFDKIYTRVQEFYTNKQLNVADYDSLKTAADSAQTDAQASVEALASLNVDIDCTSQTVAESVSAFREAVKNTRDSLKDYRKALVDLINSLKGASTGTGSDTTDTESTNGTAQ